MFEEPGRSNIDAGERFIGNQQIGVVQQSRGDEHALFHPLRIRSDGRMTMQVERK